MRFHRDSIFWSRFHLSVSWLPLLSSKVLNINMFLLILYALKTDLPPVLPVSYTHLDVYKRQMHHYINHTNCSYTHTRPVSYTHLDVYKRQVLTSHDLDIKNCRGQSYGNVSNMSGVYSGLQTLIKEVNSHAEFIPHSQSCGHTCS